MNINSYGDLLAAARSQAQPQRLLFAFARAELPEDAGEAERARFHGGAGGALTPVMCVDKAVEELGSFDALVSESQHTGQMWDVVFVSTMSGRGGKAPAPQEADAPLNSMVAAIHMGEVSRFLAFNRAGDLLNFS